MSDEDDGPTKIRSAAPAQKQDSSSKQRASEKEDKSKKVSAEKKPEDRSKKTPEKPSAKDAKEEKSPKEKTPVKKTPAKEKTPGKRKGVNAEESTPKAKKSKPAAEAATPDEVRQKKAENYRKFLERQHAGPKNPGAREVPEVSITGGTWLYVSPRANVEWKELGVLVWPLWVVEVSHCFA